jgi:hypothetical protein
VLTRAPDGGGQDLLGIYLNDHLAGATAGAELAHRMARSQAGPASAGTLQGLAAEIARDRSALRDIMAGLGVPVRAYKVAAGWVGEKAGRLKLNGELLRFSPLSRLMEIEGLISGVSGKLSLWRVLIAAEGAHPQLDPEELTALATRAEDQLERLHELRDAAGRIAFMP